MSEEMFSGSMPDTMVDDLFSDTPSGDTGAAPTETPADDTADTGDVTDQVDETAAPDAPAAPADEPPADTTDQATEPPADDAAKPDVPEGATLRDRNGKKEYVFPEERGKTVYAGYKLAQEAEQVIGEPLTKEALVERQNAHDWLQTQRLEFASPDPGEQANVFQNMFREAAQALAAGEIGHDPLETAGEAFLTALKGTAPEHYDRTARFVMADQLDKLYAAAHEAKNEKLLRSVQNLDFHLNGQYVKDEELSKRVPDALSRREQDLARRERAIQDHAARQQQNQWTNWRKTTESAVAEAANAAIAQQIPDQVRKAFEAIPNGAQRLTNIKTLLDLELRNHLRNDQNWRQQKANLTKQAEMAPSEQRRAQIQQQIVQRFGQIARQVLAAKAKTILDAESVSLKQATAATHQRQAAAATQKGGVGTGKPAPRSIPAAAVEDQSWADFVESAF